MNRKKFTISIDASRERVWDTLWNEATYQQWAAVFAPGSRAETDWKKGSKVFFVDAQGNGMVSEIAENKPGAFMSIKHLGVVKDGVEYTQHEQTKGWAGAFENYTLQSVNGKTELTVEMDITDEFLEYFENTWPKALEELKEIAEAD